MREHMLRNLVLTHCFMYNQLCRFQVNSTQKGQTKEAYMVIVCTLISKSVGLRLLHAIYYKHE